MDLPRELALVALVGRWSTNDIARRLATALHYARPSKWLTGLATRIVTEFGSDPPPPLQFWLARFIAADRALGRIQARLSGETSETPSFLHLLDLPKPAMAPARGIRTSLRLPELTTPGELARWLWESPPQNWTGSPIVSDANGFVRQTRSGITGIFGCRNLAVEKGYSRVLSRV